MSVIQRKELITDEAINWPKAYKKQLEDLIVISKKLGQTAPKLPGIDPKAKKSITELQKVQSQLNIANQKGNKLVIEQKAALDRRNKSTRESVKALNDTLALQNKQLGTLEKLTLSNKKLTDERKKLNLETSKGQKRLVEINSALDKNNKTIKDNNDALGKQKINIGNYQSALGGLPGPLGNAARATGVLTKASLKFIATPIGAVIAAIGLALGTLTSFFKTSEEGQNALTKITAAASVVWDNLLDIVSSLGKAFFSLLKGDFAGMKEAFNDATDGVKNFIAETQKDIAIQNKISDLRAKNIKLQRLLTVDEAKLLRQSNELREQAAEIEETNATKAVELVRKALAVEDELASRREEITKNRIEILKVEATLANSTTEVLNEIAEAERDLENIQARRAKRARTILKEINTLQRKSNIELKKQGIIEKENAAAAGVSLQELKAKAPTSEEKVNNFLPTTDAIQERLDANLIVYEENQKKLRDIDRENKEKRNEIIQESVDLSKEIFGGFTTLRIQQISDELTALEFSRNRELENVKGNKRAEFEINKRFDEERKKLQRKQVITERANALFSIALNTAVGITNALSKVVTAPLVPFIAAAGAIQAALVLAAPIPQFDKGTESTPSGKFMVSEKQPELMKHQGKWSLIKEPTMFKNSPGDTIVSGKETDSILGSMADLTGKNMLTDPGLMLGLLNNDFQKRKAETDLSYIIKKGDAEIVRAIKNQKLLDIRVNTARAFVTEIRGQTRIDHINQQYRS